MIFRLQKKWFKISQNLNIEEQNEFLKDALELDRARPSKDMPLYLAVVAFIIILSSYAQHLQSKIMLMLLWSYIIYSCYLFNIKYNRFNKRWFK